MSTPSASASPTTRRRTPGTPPRTSPTIPTRLRRVWLRPASPRARITMPSSPLPRRPPRRRPARTTPVRQRPSPPVRRRGPPTRPPPPTHRPPRPRRRRARAPTTRRHPRWLPPLRPTIRRAPRSSPAPPPVPPTRRWSRPRLPPSRPCPSPAPAWPPAWSPLSPWEPEWCCFVCAAAPADEPHPSTAGRSGPLGARSSRVRMGSGGSPSVLLTGAVLRKGVLVRP
ncbi:hypothetical protein HMPREF9062_2432 [Actinomyces sp. oral taxon 448 str. F0400]|nr:hypothetical protein HMPREF9062_2432 [Actinomyces sp. oral taxon 448 str. F0400]